MKDIASGSAGSIVAEKLSRDSNNSVLVLEAGPKDNSIWDIIPLGFSKSYYNPKRNWMYNSTPQKELNNRSLYAPRGKVQGGSGTINAMVYVRGNAKDFDDWNQNGITNWGWKDVLPYFKKLESHPAGDTEFHSSKGKIGISRLRGEEHAISREFIKGCKELGFSENLDFNDKSLEGAGIYDVNVKNGLRSSSNREYLKPALKRKNITLITGIQVSKINFDEAGTKVISVDAYKDNQKITFAVNKELILSAGAVDTPKLLQLSGIGDKDLLAKHSIECIKHLPGVGQNLQDHICASYYYEANQKTLNDVFSSIWGQVWAGIRYITTRKGPIALSVNQAGGFFKTSKDLAEPNTQLYFNPFSYQIPKDPKAKIKPEPYSGYLMAFNQCRPYSTGEINIASSNYKDSALINPKYLSDDRDKKDVVASVRLINEIVATKAVKDITVRQILPEPVAELSDEQILDYFLDNSGSIYHLCGTARMGHDDMAVVNEKLQVHGFENLRVIDASVFPNVTSGNINGPTMMMAEKIMSEEF